MAAQRDAIVSTLLDRYGRTYAEDAGIRLAGKPSPLYRLLVLATLLSARISADIAIQAARELFAAGYTTPPAMQQASWQDRVDALGRSHYRRYDERTATMLGDGAAARGSLTRRRRVTLRGRPKGNRWPVGRRRHGAYRGVRNGTFTCMGVHALAPLRVKRRRS